jgi:hypothetical protein
MSDIALAAIHQAREMRPHRCQGGIMSLIWNQQDVEFRREWTGKPVEEIEKHAGAVVEQLTPGAGAEIVHAYAISVAEGRPFGLD